MVAVRCTFRVVNTSWNCVPIFENQQIWKSKSVLDDSRAGVRGLGRGFAISRGVCLVVSDFSSPRDKTGG
jgi:hypothetical protein